MYFFGDEISVFKPRSLEAAYAAILADDLELADAIFESLDSPRARWGIAFTSLLTVIQSFYE